MALEFAIDLGSSNTTIYEKNAGIVLKEPTIALVQQGKVKTLKSTGFKAKRLLGKVPENTQIIAPVKEGIITNAGVASLMIQDYFKKVTPDSFFHQKIKVLASVSCGLSLAERRAFENVLTEAGVSETILIDCPLASSRVLSSENCLIIDIGGGVTDIAIISPEGIISGCSLNIAGYAFDTAIMDFILERHTLKIGLYAAERLKVAIGSMFNNDIATIEVSGINAITGSPKSETITAREIREALLPLVNKICTAITTVMNQIPPEMVGEITSAGLFMCGGSAGLAGLSDYIENYLGIPTTLMRDQNNSVIYGLGTLLSNRTMLSNLLNLKSI